MGIMMTYWKKRVEMRLKAILLSIKYVFSGQKNKINSEINRLILLEKVVKTSYKIRKSNGNNTSGTH